MNKAVIYLRINLNSDMANKILVLYKSETSVLKPDLEEEELVTDLTTQ